MRLIDADELTEMVYRERVDTRERIANLIARQPTIKSTVKHGRWIPQGDDMWLCSNCKENKIFSMHESDRTDKQKYCCRCGARMDGDANG